MNNSKSIRLAVLGFMAMIALLFCLNLAFGQVPNTSYSPVLPDFWNTVSNTVNSNLTSTLNNGSNTVMGYSGIYVGKNGCSLMLSINVTNSVSTASTTVILYGDMSVDGKTNSQESQILAGVATPMLNATHPFTWSIAIPAGTNVTVVVYTNLANLVFNNASSFTLDMATNSTAMSAGTNVQNTLQWVETGVIY